MTQSGLGACMCGTSSGCRCSCLSRYWYTDPVCVHAGGHGVCLYSTSITLFWSYIQLQLRSIQPSNHLLGEDNQPVHQHLLSYTCVWCLKSCRAALSHQVARYLLGSSVV